MSDIEMLRGMNNPTHMKSVLSKLPFKLRERWRTVAYDFHKRPIQLSTLYCSKIQKANSLSQQVQVHSSLSKSSFATTSERPEQKHEISNNGSTTSMPQKTCLFCKGNYSIKLCKEFDKKKHKDKVEFFKTNGLHLGCVTKGHMNKDCKRQMTCKICAKRHPTVLHIEVKKDKSQNVESQSAESQNVDNISVQSALVTIKEPTNTEACDQQKLSIVPVQVKLKNSNQTLQTYALLDPGSTGTFCTENLRKQLKAKATQTRILLCTLGQEKVICINMVNGLEVSSLESDDFIELPPLYTQEEIPVTKEQIPTQDDVQEWNYLEEVKLPCIDADIGLLIGCDAAWAVINSKGPCAVKTRLGWVVNGLLHENTTSKTQQNHIFSNRISMVSPKDLMIQQYNHDFPVRNYEEKAEMSMEDKRFMQIMASSAGMKNGYYQLNLPFKQNITMPNNRHLAGSVLCH